MTSTYRTGGTLTNPVNDLTAAQAYLSDDDMTAYVKYASHPALQEVVHHIEWRLLTESTWQVTVVTDRLLTDEESTALSGWISGQNSDGLGEGFEQQHFAEHGYDEDYEMSRFEHDEDYEMSSFDWETNKCLLVLIK